MVELRKTSGLVLAVSGALLLAACSPVQPTQVDKPSQAAPSPTSATPSPPATSNGTPLIPAKDGVARAREYIKDPNRDPLPQDPQLAEQIRLGFRIFTETRRYAPQYVGNDLTCQNCHLNAGQREGALPLVGVANVFPEYNKRSGRLFSLEDRIVGYFLRSMNGANAPGAGARHENAPEEIAPSPRSKEVLAVSAYLTWLAEGMPRGQNPPWRGKNKIADDKRIPVEKLDPNRGKELYGEKCARCHGADGGGVELAPGLKAGPLWGSGSWNDGAGAARVYTLAGYIRYAMPYDAPGSLTDEEAQNIAAYIDAQERPAFPGKAQDYRAEKMPSDAVYYPQLFKTNPLKEKLVR